MELNKFLCIVQLAVILYGVGTRAHPVIKVATASLKEIFERSVDMGAEEGFCSRSDAMENLKTDDKPTDDKPIGCGSYKPSWAVSQMLGLQTGGGAIALPKDLPTLLKLKQSLYYRIPGMATYQV